MKASLFPGLRTWPPCIAFSALIGKQLTLNFDFIIPCISLYFCFIFIDYQRQSSVVVNSIHSGIELSRYDPGAPVDQLSSVKVI